VTRVELQAIEPPRDIQQSMELQMRAERERRAAVTNAEAGKRAAILESEGQREAQVRKAEGEKEAAILRAQGMAEARLALANAEAEAIRKVAESLPDGQAAMYLLGLKYFEALPKLAEGKGSTVFLPAEATGVMGAVGALREMLNKASTNAAENPSNVRRGSGPISASTAAYPATRPTVAVRAADTQVPLPDNPTER
jgi:regulator of protease activity HflC (stomatin/prohibitin superfamily)